MGSSALDALGTPLNGGSGLFQVPHPVQTPMTQLSEAERAARQPDSAAITGDLASTLKQGTTAEIS